MKETTPLPLAREAISRHYLADEAAVLGRLRQELDGYAALVPAIEKQAADWIRRLRAAPQQETPVDAFIRQYGLDSEEGVVLMCLAEALLRIPDEDTAERLISDKLGDADWASHLGRSESLFVNSSTWGLMLTGRLLHVSEGTRHDAWTALRRLVARMTEPVARVALRQAMRLMGEHFVSGRTIEEAVHRHRARGEPLTRYSYDMLGEAALTADDAERYLAAYEHAIAVIGGETGAGGAATLAARPGISVKLSALSPRYEYRQRERARAELSTRLAALARQAKRCAIGLTVDAEEADRLELSLDIFEAVYRHSDLQGYDGFGLAVQASQRRGLFVVRWLEGLAREVGRRIPVRLVKGAYWDTEIKRAQEQGLEDYPVFTRKAHTDVAYLACARHLLANRQWFYPQLATHNAHTIAAARAFAGEVLDHEFQRLHGMGEALYRAARADLRVPCRVYAPVGSHEHLLPYLVRRLLENGANTSFVNRLYDAELSPEALAADPLALVQAAPAAGPALPLPADLYGSARRNARGFTLTDARRTAAFMGSLAHASPLAAARPLLADGDAVEAEQPITDPADRRLQLGTWRALPVAQVPAVVESAAAAFAQWEATPVRRRADLLERASDLLEHRWPDFVALLIGEAGKTIADAIAELRETVDLLRYYAAQARALLVSPMRLDGPTGEHNELRLHGRGVVACISPWNFPLAIFTGQVAAALVAGNTVVAKPAEQTNLVACQMVALLHDAGVPRAALQCALGAEAVGQALVRQPQLAGVIFTGSVDVARAINRTLAARMGPIGFLVAETGGLNAMIVDSSALPEQVVRDVVASAFHSAGQRCSALRVLYLQEDIAEATVVMLAGAMRELRIGPPGALETDVGPLIEPAAVARLQAHAEDMARRGRMIERLELPGVCAHGSFFPPCAFEVDDVASIGGEHFGPVLHVIRYRPNGLEAVVDSLNETHFGLTLGVHSRIESTWRSIDRRARVGNTYVNRSMTGAVVGVQPFGGQGLSGTGPKAGGPNYLLRLVTERTLTLNTAAIGGNAELLARTTG